MSKSRLIPSNISPFVCCVDNIWYSYESGTTQTVPDGVADIIDNYNALLPQENPPEKYPDLPIATASKAGVVMVGAGLTIEGGVLEADVTEIPVAEYPATVDAAGIIAALQAAGLMAETPEPEPEPEGDPESDPEGDPEGDSDPESEE